jgi:FtsP/CotA-like multicopper oxidase with cupredoxin domain
MKSRLPFNVLLHAAALAGLLAACTPPVPGPVPERAPATEREARFRAQVAGLGALPVLASPPAVYANAQGILTTTLTAAPGRYRLGGNIFTGNVYNGLYAPPTLNVPPGGTLNISLVNQVNDSIRGQRDTAWTNLHTHGLNVSPKSPGDDVLLRVPNQTTFRYNINLPPWHRPGLYWYHPHPHGRSETQVLGGMSGALVVSGLTDYFPPYEGIREVVMLLKDHVDPAAPEGAKIKSINGLPVSEIRIAPNELQLWRIANVGADAYYNLKLVDIYLRPVPFEIIARDGNAVIVDELLADSVLLPPSSRVEVVVWGRAEPLYLLSDSVDTGPVGDPNPPVLLAQVGSPRSPAAPSSPRPAQAGLSPRQRALADTVAKVLRDSIGANRRTFVFSEDTANNIFFINDSVYDPRRVDTRVPVPSTEVWTLVNASPEVHVFHIHQGDFLVTEINGVPQTVTGFVDTVNLPYQANGQPGVVKIVIPFTNPLAMGEFVYHCHILEHEDGGMMQNIMLYPAGTQPPAPRPRAAHH